MIKSKLLNVGEQISDATFLAKIIAALPSDFRYMLSAWDNLPAQQQTYDNLINKLLKEETLNKLTLGNTVVDDNVAFQSAHFKQNISIHNNNILIEEILEADIEDLIESRAEDFSEDIEVIEVAEDIILPILIITITIIIIIKTIRITTFNNRVTNSSNLHTNQEVIEV